LARIINLKNRKAQPQEPKVDPVRNSPPRKAPLGRASLVRHEVFSNGASAGEISNGVETTAVKPHQFVRPKPQENAPPPQPAKPKVSEPETKVLTWSGPLYIYRPNMKAVLTVSLVLFAVAALLQIFQKNIITTIFFGLLGVMILIRAGKKPEVVNFEINPLGVRIGERLYGFREIKSFWVEYEPALDIKELSLQLNKWYLPYVKIPIYDQNPLQLRLTLLAFLPEVEHKDTLAETISRKLGI
jgi:hypothetical protein